MQLHEKYLISVSLFVKLSDTYARSYYLERLSFQDLPIGTLFKSSIFTYPNPIKRLGLMKTRNYNSVHYYLCSLILEKFSRNFFLQQKSRTVTEHRNLLKCTSTSKLSVCPGRVILAKH